MNNTRLAIDVLKRYKEQHEGVNNTQLAIELCGGHRNTAYNVIILLLNDIED